MWEYSVLYETLSVCQKLSVNQVDIEYYTSTKDKNIDGNFFMNVWKMTHFWKKNIQMRTTMRWVLFIIAFVKNISRSQITFHETRSQLELCIVHSCHPLSIIYAHKNGKIGNILCHTEVKISASVSNSIQRPCVTFMPNQMIN